MKNIGVIKMPTAIKGALINGELGYMTGPFVGGERAYNMFESIDGRIFQTTLLCGFDQDGDYAFYAHPTEKELRQYPRQLLLE